MRKVVPLRQIPLALLPFILFVSPFLPLADGAEIEPIHRVGLGEAHKGTLEVDTLLLDSYGKPPDPERGFYLKARGILEARPEALTSDPEIVEAALENGLHLIGGPMLGDLSDSGVSVWFRPVKPDGLEIRTLGSDGTRHNFPISGGRPGSVVRVRLSGLSPDSEYRYRVVDETEETLAEGSFRTAPKPETKGTTRIAFGADFHKIGLHNPNLFREVLEREPLVMLLYGDLAADGRRGNFNMHRADYLLRDASQPWNRFVARMPIYTSWDDWDYFHNDQSGVSADMTESDRIGLRAMWREQWVNPGSDPDREGIYFSTRLGPVEIFLLDTRSCRENARLGEYASFLGPEQHEWLKDGLRNSTAPFKIVSSGTMWSDYVSNAKDSWGIWDREGREEIFRLIEEEKIGGVLLISGDRHGARGFTIPRDTGFAFHEFNVGTLGGVNGPKGRIPDCEEQLFGYDGRGLIAFGEFTFDTAVEDPTVTFRLIHETGEILEEHTFDLSDLTP